MDKNVIWVDENDKVLGEVSYEKAHREGLWHRIAVVYLINDKQQVLMQKRADGRFDHSAAGHVDGGESYLAAAQRELAEELGVSGVGLKELGYCGSDISRETKHKFMVFWCQADPVRLDPKEVAAVFWKNPADIWEDMKGDRGNIKYCGGFKATLKLYLEKR